MSDFQPEEIKLINDQFDDLLNYYKAVNPNGNIAIVQKAFQLAYQAHDGMRRRSGEPYIMHPIAVAEIVAKEIGLGATSISASLLHDVVEDTEYTIEEMEQMFNPKIASIVDGLTKIAGATTFKSDSIQAENFRKLLLTMSDDIRVILIKIADRLHNMRTLGSMPPHKQYKIAAETLFVYAPLSHRLGLYNIKSELEDLAFKYEHPATYADLASKISHSEEERDELFRQFTKPIEERLKILDFNFTIKKRIKSVYSIWKKMQQKDIPFEEVFDLMATRIVFEPKTYLDEKVQCWNIYSAITSIYRPKPDRIRDWISVPKANGYEALHMTVMGPKGRWFEVQIRSQRMDEIAEKGYAAHWKYKSGPDSNETELERWLKTIRELLETPESNAIEFMNDFKLNLFSQEIMVFTPKGEMKVLPQGATALDFAFEIHTELGLQCIGAKVNHNLVPLSHKLKSGDQVEIITSSKQKPQEEWLSFVTTARAKSKIKGIFKNERKKFIKAGEKRLEEKLNKLKLTTNSRILKKLEAYFDVETREELMYNIGRENIEIDNLQDILREKTQSKIVKYWRLQFGNKKNKQTPEKKQDSQPISKRKSIQLTDDKSDIDYTVATCCNPIPGDDVIGYVDENDNVVLHKRQCEKAIKLMSNYGNQIVDATWISHKLHSFLSIIKINGIDKQGMLSQISKVISEDQDVNMREVHFGSHDGVFEGIIHLYVHNVEDVNNLIFKIVKIKGITNVQRVEQSQLSQK
ncbi:RelA/SpoT family protein [Saccharicrinis sp. FJH54]|uniref:RelA/SpoT family protein n=1 Tax=Saccharicrinis sp. FJH54 TaxID=3344665 RepID=UPI0035D4FB62